MKNRGSGSEKKLHPASTTSTPLPLFQVLMSGLRFASPTTLTGRRAKNAVGKQAASPTTLTGRRAKTAVGKQAASPTTLTGQRAKNAVGKQAASPTTLAGRCVRCFPFKVALPL